MLSNQDDVLESQLRAQLKETDEALNKTKSIASKRKKIIDTIAEKCCDSAYITKQLGGPNTMVGMRDEEKRDFIISNILNQKKKYISMISELQEKYLNSEKEKQDIAQKYLNMKSEKERLQKTINNLKQEITLNNNQNFKLKEKEEVININAEEKTSSINPSSTTTKTIIMNGEPYDVKDVQAHLNIMETNIIKYFAEEGLSEQKEILEGLKAKFTQYGINAIKDSLESLTNKHLINRIDESLPIQSKLVLLELSDLGKEIYYIETGKKAKLSEIEYMKHNHASLKHGYAIKRISEILRVQGYKNVCYDSRENTIALNDNRRYVPDIIANLDDKTKTYWEVEYAHHTDVAFTEKIDKAAKVTNTLYIIGSDKKAKEKLKRQIDEYQKNLFINDGKMKLDIYLGTMTELQKKTFLNLPDNHIKIRA